MQLASQIALLLALVLTAGCSSSESRAPTVGDDSATTDTAEPIGVAECDDYIGKMRACLMVETIPREIREAASAGLDSAINSWRPLDDKDRANLPVACAAARRAAASSYAERGCSF